jgi:hypothetical protein
MVGQLCSGQGGRTMPERLDRTLSDFGKSTLGLAEMLERDPQLGLIEQVFIENHIHILQSAYNTWKRRNASSKKDAPDNPDVS